jgi:Leucine-rich repeat (LRR) protein
VQGIWAAENAITGSIPSELGLLENLSHFVMDTNQLTGEIPEELMNLPLMEQLDVTNNKLSGVVPEGLCAAYDSSVFRFDCSASLCGCDCDCVAP